MSLRRKKSKLSACGLLALALLVGGPRWAATQQQQPSPQPSPFTAPIDRVETQAEEDMEIMAKESKGWHLTFQDEFDGDGLDGSKWITSFRDGRRTHDSNKELEYFAPDSVIIQDGKLRLLAEKRDMGDKHYTSGMICSYDHFQQAFGWFEMRAKVPHAQGMWPTFWLLPLRGGWPPEIDIEEGKGNYPSLVYLTNHYGTNPATHGQEQGSFSGPDFSAGYHTYAIDWEAREITWYVDGVQRFRVTKNIPLEPMYMIVDLAVGGIFPGAPDDKKSFPAEMDVDYVRVYQRQ